MSHYGDQFKVRNVISEDSGGCPEDVRNWPPLPVGEQSLDPAVREARRHCHVHFMNSSHDLHVDRGSKMRWLLKPKHHVPGPCAL